MKNSNILWGLIFVFVGTIILLQNFDVINFHWNEIWRYWPLILVFSGLNIIFSRSGSSIGKWSVAILTLGILSAVAFFNINKKPSASRDSWYESEQSESSDSSIYDEEYEGSKYATLNLSGGANSFNIAEGSQKLISASINDTKSDYFLRKTLSDSTAVLNFQTKNKKRSFDLEKNHFGDVNIKLHKDPIWTINLNMGAGKADFNFSKNHVSHITLKGGAADFNIKLGDLQRNVDLLAETGIAKIDIAIPSSSGCKITTSTGLSAKDFPTFTKLNDNEYVTDNYNDADNIINMTLKGGLSDFTVSRY